MKLRKFEDNWFFNNNIWDNQFISSFDEKSNFKQEISAGVDQMKTKITLNFDQWQVVNKNLVIV